MEDRTLAREIALVLVIKRAAIAVIMDAFFNPETQVAAGSPEHGAHLLPAPAPTAPDNTR